jgi:hypothetical protein
MIPSWLLQRRSLTSFITTLVAIVLFHFTRRMLRRVFA